MFWHGRNFAWKASNYMMWYLFKAMLFSAPLFFFNMHNGFSAHSYLDFAQKALFEVLLSTVGIYTYLLLEQDVSFHDADAKESRKLERREFLPNLPQLYAYKIKTHLSKKLLRFAAWTAWMWATAAILFYVPFKAMTNIVGKDGKTGNLWGCGFASFTFLVLIHNGSVFIGTRNFTWPVVTVYFFSLLFYMPITLLVNEYLPSGTNGPQYQHQVFSDYIGGSPLFALCLIFSVGTVLMPIYMAKAYEMLIKEPALY